ncbi:MAG: polyamine aminopropyltransferase [Bacillota bacterium]
MFSPEWKWLIEFTHPTQAHMHGVKRYIYSGKTAYQDVEIIETDFFGRCLVLDGKIQSSEYDEFIYHESLVHPAMIIHPDPREIIVLGGGEGGALREILKYSSVEELLMVDIDRDVVSLCEKYLPEWNRGAFKDPRTELLFMDARKYMENNNKRWDVIFIDITEPLDDSPAYLLFTREFYQLLTNRLKKNGIIALQAGNLNPRLLYCHGAIYNTLKQVYRHVDSYGPFIPSYDTVWGFLFVSHECSARDYTPEMIDNIIAQREIKDLKYYDGLTHTHIFTLPRNLRMLRSREKRIIEDKNPLFTI